MSCFIYIKKLFLGRKKPPGEGKCACAHSPPSGRRIPLNR
ncbi:hypothetical protein HMPREF3293_02759 [Christensenella minuta]|uniref:Uncharacterized protein n=1 Tax=Christensenella minuta TaxID=626937 RepID=A0A136Q1Y0_9FIRM|nr:hypothetical protein HMPREF3293_02759 [Christensenella minuta]